MTPGRPESHAASPDVRSGRAFSLIELIVVLAIAGVLAAVAAPALSSTTRTNRAAAAGRLLHDLTFARQNAVATGTRTWVTFNVGADVYTLLSEDPAAPGRSGASPLLLGDGAAITVDLSGGDYPGAGLLLADFDGSPEVGFDWLGAPLNGAETPLAADGRVTLRGGFRVDVAATTGQITLTTP